MNLKCEIVEKTSKSGNPYKVLVLHLTDTCTKDIFLTSAELELLKLKETKEDDKPDTDFWK